MSVDGKLFIDTQVLYELIGFDRNSKVKNTKDLREYLKNRSNVIISSIAISEILVKQRYFEDRIVKILEFLRNNHFCIANSHILDFDCATFVAHFSNKAEIEDNIKCINKQINNRILAHKAYYESDFIEFFITLAKLYVGLLSCFYLSLPFVEGMRLVKVIIASQNRLGDVKIGLLESYNADPKEYVKTVFNESISKFLSLIADALKERIKEKTHNSNMKKYVKKVNAYQSEQQPLKILKFLETQDFLKAESPTDDVGEQKREILSDIKKEIGRLLYDKVGNIYFLEYVMLLFDNWRVSGNKFMKNDISDMIILMSLYEPNSEIITFDDKNYDFLEAKGHPSIALIDRFYSRHRTVE